MEKFSLMTRSSFFISFFIVTIFIFTFGLGLTVRGAEDTGLIPCRGPDCNFDTFIQLIQKVINFLLVTVAIPLATVLFSYAGLLYLSATGDTGKISQAHGIFLNVIFGLALALAAWLIVNTIATALLKDSFKSNFLFLKQSSAYHKAFSG